MAPPPSDVRRASDRGGAVLLLARRILLRTRPPRGLARWLPALALVAVAVGALGLFVFETPEGQLQLWAPLTFGVGVMVLGSAWLVRIFVPTVAVSAIGIAWGVAALFCVMSVTSGFESELLRRMGRINGHVLTTKYGLDFFEWEALSDELKRRPDVVAASPFVYGAVAMQPIFAQEEGEGEGEGEGADEDQDTGPRDPTVVGLKGVDAKRMGDFEGVESLFVGGSVDAIRPGQFHTDPPGVVVGERLARRLKLEPGDLVRIVAAAEVQASFEVESGAPRAATFVVTDLLQSGVSDIDATMVLVDIRAGMSLLYGEGRATGIELGLVDARSDDEVAAAVAESLNADRHLALYRTNTTAEGSTPIIVMRNIRRIVSVIMSLIVLVAGTTLIGALLLIVRRRQWQIAVLSTVGARRTTIFAIFEAAGLVAGVAGALTGLALGGALSTALANYRWPLDAQVYPLDYMPVDVRWMDAVVPALVAVAVCALVSGPVALHASRLRPIDAMRL